MKFRIAVIFTLFGLLFPALALGQSEQELYQTIFGRELKTQEIELPLYDGPFYLAEVRTTLEQQTIVSFHKKDLVVALRDVLRESSYREVLKLKGTAIKPEELPKIQITYDPVKLQLNLRVQASVKKPRRLSLGQSSGIPDNIDKAIAPAPYSGAVTMRAEQTQASSGLGPSFFQAQLDSFIHVKGFVLENQSNYQGRFDEKWFRGDTRLIKDFSEQNIRWQLGDIQNQSIGDLPFQRLGGVSFSRNFQLDPYRTNLPFGSQEFTINSRSRVNTYVNGSLIKSEVLPAGNYNISDIPLNNGLNRITIETEDELGKKEVFEFQQSSSLQLLNPGESRFDLSVGHRYEDNDRMRNYLDEEPLLTSGFYQYGFNSKQTLGLYAQQQGSFNQQGLEYNHATNLGVFSVGGARGKNTLGSGAFASASYQLTQIGRSWSDAYQVALQYDYRERTYQNSNTSRENLVASNLRAQFSMPIARGLTASLGYKLSEMRDDLARRYSQELGLNTRINNRVSVSLFASRNRNEFKEWSNQAYVFLTYSMPRKSQYAQALYNTQNNSSRVTLNSDNQNKLNTVRSQASLENSDTSQEAALNLTYLTSFADFKLNGLLRHQKLLNEEQTRGSVGLSTSLAFVGDGEQFRAELTRPVNNSFALFTSEYKDTPIELRSSAIYNEAAKGPFGNTVFTNLIPYQYRDVRLDSIHLKAGQSYAQENFLLYPTYKSAHLITAKIDGQKSLRAILLDLEGKPLSLATGHLTPESAPTEKIPFFTNRDGKVFINGLKKGRYILKINGKRLTQTFSISRKPNPVEDLGALPLKKGVDDDNQ